MELRSFIATLSIYGYDQGNAVEFDFCIPHDAYEIHVDNFCIVIP